MATPKQAGRVSVQVVCVARGTGFSKDMLVPVGQTLGWAVNASGLYGLRPELRDCEMGVWGKRMAPETLVAEGDRVEVYLACDPAAVARARNLKRNIATGAN